MKRVMLSDIADVTAGQSAPQGDSNYCDNGIPFIKAGNLLELLSGTSEQSIQQVNGEVAKKYKLKLYPEGAILFAKSGMSCMKGYVYKTQQECYVVNHLAVVIPKWCEGDYLKYYFQYHKPNSLIKDEAYPSISLQDIGNVELIIPSQDEQKKIASILNKVYNLVTLRKEQLTKLDELVKSQFIKMFGDPVINPMEWNTATVGDVCARIIGGGTPSKKHPEYFTGSIPWVSPKDMKSQTISDSVDHINVEAIKNSTTKMVPANSVLMVIRSGVLKHDLPIAINSVPVAVNQDMKVFVPNEQMTSSFLMQLFHAHEQYLLSTVRAVTADNIEFSVIRDMVIIVPPIDKQNQFVVFVEQVDKSKVEIQKSLEKLETLKKALMQQYFG